MLYTKYPKNIRFDEVILNEAEVYMRQTGMTFSDLVRLALQFYLKRKLYRE
jgi:antitoxin component of RelBE/YafQ-DinJ toxin-antitoxin module